MRRSQFRASAPLLAALLLVAFNVSAQNNSASAPPEIGFTVSMSKPSTHLLEVEMRVRAERFPAQLNLIMPVWSPGSYLIREFERHVQDFAVTDAATGRALTWKKTNKDTWRVETGGARDLRATNGVDANDLSVRTNDLNDRH